MSVLKPSTTGSTKRERTCYSIYTVARGDTAEPGRPGSDNRSEQYWPLSVAYPTDQNTSTSDEATVTGKEILYTANKSGYIATFVERKSGYLLDYI
jgi:hypothetical protein